MTGIDENLFIDLSERDKNNLICSICLNIFNNPVIGDQCVHSFCKECIKQWIDTNHKVCPTCKARLTRKRANSAKKWVIISGYAFKPNIIAKAMIDELNTKCEFQFNGCEEVIAFGLLSSHLNVCEHRLCSKCGFKAGRPEDHNCVQLLKAETDRFKTERNQFEIKMEVLVREKDELSCNQNKLKNELTQIQTEFNDYKNKFEESKRVYKEINKQNLYLEERIEKYREKNKQLEQKYNEEIEKNAKNCDDIRLHWYNTLSEESHSHNRENTENVDKIRKLQKSLDLLGKQTKINFFYSKLLIGTYVNKFGSFDLDSYGIKLIKTPITGSTSNIHLLIPFSVIDELYYCPTQSFPAIIFKINSNSCHEIRQSLHLSEFEFDIYSTEPKHRYIILFFENDSEFKSETMDAFLALKSRTFKQIRRLEDTSCQKFISKIF